MKALFCFIFLCFFCRVASDAQPVESTSITGTVKDSVTGAFLDPVTVSLRTLDRQPLKSAVTKEGIFTISDIKPGEYFLLFSHVSYKPKVIKISVKDTILNTGAVALLPAAANLKEVAIVTDKPIVRQETDRLVYDLQADPESKANNVLEMMRKIPLLSVDASDNIQLQGSSNFRFLVDGKPSAMMERNAKDILKSMPATSVQRIEVITTPSAKYDGEGLAGIINIVTIKKTGDGYNASINLNERFPAGGLGGAGTFTCKKGKWGNSIIGGASQNNMPETINNLDRKVLDGPETNVLAQDGRQHTKGDNEYLSAELSYEADSFNLITGQFNWNRGYSATNGSQTSMLSDGQDILQGYTLNSDRDVSGNGIDASLNYQAAFRRHKGSTLTFSYRFLSYRNDQQTDIMFADKINYGQPDYNQQNNAGLDEHSFQTDYTVNIKKVNIEAGIKGIFRNNKSRYLFEELNAQSGNFETDSLKSNSFDLRQDVWSGYASSLVTLMQWNIKAGMRLEETIIRYSGNDRNYLNVIPVISLGRRFRNQTSLNIGFTSRIQRPGIIQLNPFVDRSNPNAEISGNPLLKPMAGNSLDINYTLQRKFSLTVGTRALWINDMILPQVVLDPASDVTRSTYNNIGESRLLAGNVNLTYPFSKMIRLTVTGNLAYATLNGEIDGQPQSNDGWMARAFAGLGMRTATGWQFNANLNYIGRRVVLQGYTNGFTGSSFSITKDLLAGKLSCSLAANNPFSKYRNIVSYTDGPGFTQETLTQVYLRGFTLSINYKFGRLKGEIHKIKKGISNNDAVEGDGL